MATGQTCSIDLNILWIRRREASRQTPIMMNNGITFMNSTMQRSNIRLTCVPFMIGSIVPQYGFVSFEKAVQSIFVIDCFHYSVLFPVRLYDSELLVTNVLQVSPEVSLIELIIIMLHLFMNARRLHKSRLGALSTKCRTSRALCLQEY